MHLALLAYRNKPIWRVEYSPAQLLVSRMLKDRLPTATRLLSPKVAQGVHKSLLARQQRQKRYHDRGTKALPALQIGVPVTVYAARAYMEPCHCCREARSTTLIQSQDWTWPNPPTKSQISPPVHGGWAYPTRSSHIASNTHRGSRGPPSDPCPSKYFSRENSRWDNIPCRTFSGNSSGSQKESFRKTEKQTIMNIDFVEQCYGTQVFSAWEMLSAIVTSATLKFSSLHLGFILFGMLHM